jgi:predicted RNase H-like nuclease
VLKFLGIDLGWSTGASGLCCLGWQPGTETLEILDWQCYQAMPEILEWVDAHLPGTLPGLVAVDAPTLIPNPTGMRICDRLAHHHYGRYHAGCYPANQGSSFAPKTTGFGQALEQRGFAHAPTITPQQPGRYQIEVFPHAAMIGLFQLAQIIKYKKGRLADRRQGLAELRQQILTHLPQHQPGLAVAELPAIPTTGPALKNLEDRLDSLVCAYIGAHWWYWGPARNRVLGGAMPTEHVGPFSHAAYLATGYIVVPDFKAAN